jgi:hypothetical protein
VSVLTDLPDRAIGGGSDLPNQGFGPRSAAAVARAGRVAAGDPTLHLIERVSFGDGRHTKCTCGWTTSGARSDVAQASDWQRHVAERRQR